ncbi:MAG: sulfatase-like hydrolase/transferase [Clostridia bacterium]
MKKPNILFILSDDQGYWATGKHDREIVSPNLNRLSDKGVTFDNFFCVSPVCSPARLSIFTGKIPSAHGVHDWIAKGHIDSNHLSDDLKENFANENRPEEYNWPRNQLSGDTARMYLNSQRCFTNALAENGYDCSIIGKWHMGESEVPQAGFTDFRTLAMGGDNYMFPVICKDGVVSMLKNKYVTDYVTENAVEMIQSHPKDKPFYLSVHYTAPHAPWDKEQHPKEIYDMYEYCDFTATPNVPIHKDADIYGMNDKDYQAYRIKCLRGYYSAITGMDIGIGKILDTLKEQNELDNTIIIFTADNGMSMGHHGIFGKGNGTYPMNMYDTAVKVPMIISYPQQFKSGFKTKALCSHYDIYPTLMDLLDIKTEDLSNLPGSSFKEILLGNDNTGNESVIVYDEYGPVRMIRTQNYKYIRRFTFDNYDEFYDLKADPDELNNCIDKPEFADIINTMKNELEEWFNKYSVPQYDGKYLDVHGIGQLEMLDGDTNKQLFK